MLYSQQDIQSARNQLLRRIGLMAALAILPNVAGIVVMYTIRIEWLSVLLGCLGGAMAIFTWGLFCYPVYTFIAPYQLHRLIELIKTRRRTTKSSATST